MPFHSPLPPHTAREAHPAQYRSLEKWVGKSEIGPFPGDPMTFLPLWVKLDEVERLMRREGRVRRLANLVDYAAHCRGARSLVVTCRVSRVTGLSGARGRTALGYMTCTI